jgi:DNA-binding PadR family transcriptional regulator
MRLLLCPSLLVLLTESESHGYELYDQLTDFGFDLKRLDSSIVYRELRELDDFGFIKSTWDIEDTKGPKRRVYQIRPEGLLRLEEWIIHLQRIGDRIERLVTRFEELKEVERNN